MVSPRSSVSGTPGFAGRFFGPGELRLALLALLGEQGSHGYELMNRLEAKFDGAYQASAGAIYPTLQQLEDERLVRVETSEERKVYQLTPAGLSEVDTRAGDIDQIWARATSRGQWGTFRDPHAAEILAPALRLMKAAVKTIVHSHKDPIVVDQVRGIIEDARRHIEGLDRRRRK